MNPIVVKDRIAYIGQGNIAVCFFWTERTNIIPYLEKNNLAIASNLYSHQKGIEPLIRNCLANPGIRYLILLGNIQDKKAYQTLKNFLEHGLNENRSIIGFEDETYIDKNITMEDINLLRNSIEVFDLTNKENLEEQIQEANNLIKTLDKKEKFSNPKTYDFETPETKTFPYEGGPLLIRGNTIMSTWIKIIYSIMRYGIENLMDQGTDRVVREINNMVAVISDEDPDNPNLSKNPLGLSIEQVKNYQREILSGDLPPGKAYTYGNKLRQYEVHPSKINHLLNIENNKVDFEFKEDRSLLIKNAITGEDKIKINQVKDIIECLKRNINTKNAVGITWHVEDELVRKHKSSPCAIFIQSLIQNNKLNLTVYFRSHDMYNGWPENAYGFRALQKEMCNSLGIELGLLTIISGSAQIYHHIFKIAEQMLEKYYQPLINYNDERGNYLISIEDEKIKVEHQDKKGIILDTFEGSSAKEIYDRISFMGTSENPRHLIYLGSELMKAELALKQNKEYIQDQDLE